MAKTQGPTYQPSKMKRIRKFGYIKRSSQKHGLKVIKSRIAKGRYWITLSSKFDRVEKNKMFPRSR
ncbi:MAG: 50S ribosomal protein L34 [Candidatus Dojkabacteria bacterium]|nr:50S ribosomal protein L34 [Candidatus Dojkabacteria bacterium]